jgi:hypothetical protein
MARKVELTIKPGIFIDVEDADYTDLKRQGLIKSEAADKETPKETGAPRSRKGSATKKEVDTE